MPRSYSIGEFADELGVHAQTVKRWCRNDELDYTRTPGGERRIPHRELRRLAGDTRPTDRVTLYARV
ncbi:IS607 family transposase, partial [Halobacteriales archaeon SW_5_68_122]